VVWQSDDQDSPGVSDGGIFARMYNSDGGEYGNEFQVNQFVTGDQAWPQVASLDNGGYTFVWQSQGQGVESTEVVARVYQMNGTPVGNEFVVNSHEQGAQVYPSVATGSGSHSWVSWSGPLDESSSGIGLRKVAFAGSLVGSELHFADGDGIFPAVAGAESGDFLMVWRWNSSLKRQLIAADGEPIGETSSGPTGGSPSVATLGSGYVLVFVVEPDVNQHDVHVLKLTSDGSPTGEEMEVNSVQPGYQGNADVAAFSDGNYIVVWQSNTQDGDSGGIFAQRYDADDNRLYK